MVPTPFILDLFHWTGWDVKGYFSNGDVCLLKFALEIACSVQKIKGRPSISSSSNDSNHFRSNNSVSIVVETIITMGSICSLQDWRQKLARLGLKIEINAFFERPKIILLIDQTSYIILLLLLLFCLAASYWWFSKIWSSYVVKLNKYGIRSITYA